MDKRWRNLLIILVIVVIAIALFTYKDSIFNFQNPEEARLDAYFTYMEKNDINYIDLKLSLEFFEERLPDNKINELYETAPDDYIKGLLNFEKKQTKLIDEYDLFFSEGFTVACDDMNTMWDTLDEMFDLVIEMADFVDERNELLVNVDVLEMDQFELYEAAMNFYLVCEEIKALDAIS